MPLDPARRFPLMCLTLDGTGLSHSAQAEEMCAAGARWVQLRMKDADESDWLAQARAAARACHSHGAVFIVNDSVEVAANSGADGVHLGSLDSEWSRARGILGPDFLVGGTVNTHADALRAVESGCLDYAGVGPLRFTATKRNLAPVLGLDGVRGLISALGDLPAWVIGGVEPADLQPLRAAGAAGAAVSSALCRSGSIAENVARFTAAWNQDGAPSRTLIHS